MYSRLDWMYCEQKVTGGTDGATQAANPPSNQPTSPAAQGAPFNMFDANQAGGGGGTGSSGRRNLDFLRYHPEFNNMRRLIQANPSALPQLLQTIDQTNPALLEMINDHRAEFVQLINEPVGEGEEGGDEAVEQLAQAMAGAGGPGGSGGLGPGQIYVTEEENAQINRLTELGSSIGLGQAHVLEAWLACERDENLAANFLFDHAEELRAAQEEDAVLASAQQSSRDQRGDPGAGGNEEGDGKPPAGS